MSIMKRRRAAMLACIAVREAVPDELDLYSYGDFCEDVTGGWSGYAANSVNTDHMYKSIAKSDYGYDDYITYTTVNAVDISKYKTLNVLYGVRRGSSSYTITTGQAKTYIGVGDEFTAAEFSGTYGDPDDEANRLTMSVDISGVNDPVSVHCRLIRLASDTSSQSTYFYVYRVWLSDPR